PRRATIFPYTTLFRSSGSNGRPADYKSAALPTELRRPVRRTGEEDTLREQRCQISYSRLWLGTGARWAPILSLRLVWRGRRAKLDRKSTRLNSSHVAI